REGLLEGSRSCRFLLLTGAAGSVLRGLRRVAAVRAAFVGEEPDQRLHGGIVRAADQRGRLPLLGDEARVDKALQVVRQCRSCDAELVLHAADRKAFRAGADEDAVEMEPGRVADGLQPGGCYFEFHGNSMLDPRRTVNSISMI